MRQLRKRALVTFMSVLLLCAMGTTAQAGVVPWIWNLFFGPADAPLFAGRGVRAGYCPPAPAYAFSPPPVNWAPTTAYAPATYAAPSIAYSAPTIGYSQSVAYAPSVSYAPMTGCGTCTDGCVTSGSTLPAPFEYSGYVPNSNCCGTSNGAMIGGQIIDGNVINGTVIDDVVIDSPRSNYEPSREGSGAEESSNSGSNPEPPIQEPPTRFEEPSRPSAGSGMDIEDDAFEFPDTGGSRREPVGEVDTDELFNESNKPVSDAPEGPSAQTPRLTPITVSFRVGAESGTKLRRTFTSDRARQARRSLRWISVPGDGRKARL